jgi:hypothetical protein
VLVEANGRDVIELSWNVSGEELEETAKARCQEDSLSPAPDMNSESPEYIAGRHRRRISTERNYY